MIEGDNLINQMIEATELQTKAIHKLHERIVAIEKELLKHQILIKGIINNQ
jgi:hypothetical protein